MLSSLPLGKTLTNVAKCHPLAKKPPMVEHFGNPFWKNLAKMLQTFAGAHKQESCRHIRTSHQQYSPSPSGEQKPVTPPAVACQHTPRPLDQGQVLTSLPWRVGRTSQARQTSLLGDPLVESSFPPIADGNHIPFKGALLSPFTSLLGSQLPGPFQFLHSSNLRATLLSADRCQIEHAICSGQPTNRPSCYYSRH